MKYAPTFAIIASGVLLAAGLSAPALADSSYHGRSQVSIDHCLHAAKKIKRGDFLKVEFLDPSHKGVPTYEIELADKGGREWEFMCDANNGSIYEIEQEVESADDKRFADTAKIREKEAVTKAEELYEGKAVEVEYELEANGDPTYEVDVETRDGTEFKVEVDAVSGNVIEVHVEQWEIGEEPEEQRKGQDDRG